MKHCKPSLGLVALSFLLALPAHAGSGNASEAGKHSGLAAGHSVVAGTQVASAAVAVPLIVTGVVGEVSGEVGGSLMDHASKPRRLEISDEVIVADPAPRHLPGHRDAGREGLAAGGRDLR
jgi:hypothetical protein